MDNPFLVSFKSKIHAYGPTEEQFGNKNFGLTFSNRMDSFVNSMLDKTFPLNSLSKQACECLSLSEESSGWLR